MSAAATRQMPSYADTEVDVCIIGSGAGGGPVALELARGGASVVVLEKGPWYTRTQFTHDELDICRRNFFVPFVADEPHLVSPRAGDPLQASNLGWTANCVGGGTAHMSGYFFRLHPEDFALTKRYPKLDGTTLADWPITYADLAPYYDKVEREVGISGRMGDNPFEPPRSGPYAFPPLAFNPLARVIDQASQKLGWHACETPRAIISQPSESRAGCAYCNYCGSFGCEVDAKSSTGVSVIPRAVATKRCEVRTQSMAYELVHKDGRVSGVRYFDKDGVQREQRARVVVVSATAIESARLLLNSKVPNKNGLIGKHLSFSTLGKVWADFERTALPEDLRADHPNHFLQRSLQDHYFLSERKGGYDKGGTIVFQLAHRNAIFTAERIARRQAPIAWGDDLKRGLYRAYRDVIGLEAEVFGEFLPNAGTFVTTSTQVKDKWGLPVAQVQVSPHAEDVTNSRLLTEKALQVLQGAGATEHGTEAIGGTTFVLQHGTARFGRDAKTSVLDAWCRSHEVKNLFVVDGSFMPSSGGVPTTWTILANAFRVGAYLTSRRHAGESW